MTNRTKLRVAALLLTAVVVVILALARRVSAQNQSVDPIADNAQKMVSEGRRIFRFDTFGDEAFWGDALKLHRAIAGAKLGGVGPGVSPKTALALG